ncbi:EbsA family protein [Streptococcus oriscaviae]|uniref:EbsA family protein n=1 Tax=Streptococcus oriscaviae TaxID=2781599 RepID=A0ABX7YMA3_9STRE|nr:EbsA family protein [Streptococcus oriscaviae]QUE54394.1 EbsA family protein [Streptococcus oriscaviae]
MIKLFGKIRYHWQPELSWAIIYWSLAITPIFIGMSLVYERARISNTIFILFFLFIFLFGIGLHRYFEIKEDHLLIASANPFVTRRLPIASIKKIEVTYLYIRICAPEFSKGKVFYMRKWPKKYFVNALALNPNFKGEIELIDHLIKQDYFEEYYSDKAKSVR